MCVRIHPERKRASVFTGAIAPGQWKPRSVRKDQTESSQIRIREKEKTNNNPKRSRRRASGRLVRKVEREASKRQKETLVAAATYYVGCLAVKRNDEHWHDPCVPARSYNLTVTSSAC